MGINNKRILTILFLLAPLISACGGGGSTPSSSPTLPVVSITDSATSEVTNSAVAGTDYIQSSGTLTIPQGDTSGIISIPVVGDTNIEADEVFTLSLSNLSNNAVLGTSQAPGTILNDDLPQLSITSASLTEGNSGTSTLNFSVLLDAPATTDVSVDYKTDDDTATQADNDYTATSGTLTNVAGSTAGSIAVEILGDSTPEPNETFDLTLNNLTGNAALGTATATGTIINDDTADTFFVAVRDLHVVADDAGNAIAIWAQDDGSQYNARVARYSISDGAWEPAGLLETFDTRNSTVTHIAIDRTSGNAAVVWATARPDPIFGTTTDIWANRFTAP